MDLNYQKFMPNLIKYILYDDEIDVNIQDDLDDAIDVDICLILQMKLAHLEDGIDIYLWVVG